MLTAKLMNTYRGSARLNGLGATPDCPGDLVGPATARAPSGACYFKCREANLDSRYVTGNLTSGRVCFPMYGGEKWGAGHPNVLGEFKALQRALNDFIAAKNMSATKLIIDGQIGPYTLAAYNAIAPTVGLAPVSSPDALALAVYTNKPAQTIAGAVGAGVNTSVSKNPGDVRPTGSKAVNPPTPAAAGMPANPANHPTKAAWYWWVLGGAAALGVAAIGVSMVRGQDDEEALFPETV